jgi:DNA polymerase III epsilon subunit-like protein
VSLFPCRIAVVDTETTGLVEEPRASVIEVAAVCLETDGSILSEVSFFVKPTTWEPGAEWCAKALETNGIRESDLIGAVDPIAAVWALEEWFARNQASCVTSYARQFDERMLARMGCWLPPWSECVQALVTPAMAVAGLLKEPGNHTAPVLVDGVLYRPPALKAACAFYGLDPEPTPHRALNGARTAARVLVAATRLAAAVAAGKAEERERIAAWCDVEAEKARQVSAKHLENGLMKSAYNWIGRQRSFLDVAWHIRSGK